MLTYETLALLPQVSGRAWLWPRRGGDGPVHSNSALAALKKALKALRLDDEKLDQHSFRRYWFTAADAANVAMGVAMDQTDHKKPDVHMGYRRRAKSRHGQEAVQSVRQLRVDAAAELGLGVPVGLEEQNRPGNLEFGQLRPPHAASSLCSREGLETPAALASATLSDPGPPRVSRTELHGVATGRVLALRRGEHSEVLASLLGLGDDVRRALAALATQPGEQQGVLDALADLWPEALIDPRPVVRVSQRGAGRGGEQSSSSVASSA